MKPRRFSEKWIRLAMAGAVVMGVVAETARGEDVRASAASPIAVHAYSNAEAAMPQVLRQVIQRLEPALVMLETWGALEPVSGAAGRRAAMAGVAGPGDAPTTGLIVSEQGHILTSLYNLAHNPAVILVTLHDGARYPAEVLGRDRRRQVAMLKIDVPSSQSLTVPAMQPAEEVRLGQWAAALGLGYGRQRPTVSLGIVSATDRLGGLAIQTDAGISPVNYGGVLADLEGNVLGLCTPPALQAAPGMQTAQWYDSGVGFAIPLAGKQAQEWMVALQAGRTLEDQPSE